MKPFLILGASKTGTSTAVAVANAHPSVFCLFETDFSRPADKERNTEFVKLLPEAREIFGTDCAFGPGLQIISNMFRPKGWMFDHLGTKIPGLRPDILPRIGDVPTLFMIRDIRVWAVKNRVLRDVMVADTATNIVPFLTAYARYFLDSFTIERCQHLILDRIFSTDLNVFPKSIGALLDLPPEGFEEWWLKASAWKTTPPKNYSSWTEGHTSAFLPPFLADTTSHLAKHPFWQEFLPVFDKYFQNTDKRFPIQEIRFDQQILDDLTRTASMTLNEGFTRFESFKIRGLTKRDDGKFSIQATDRVTDREIDTAAGRWRAPGEEG